MKTATVSIMMPVYNGEKYIEAAIHSVAAQTFTDWELLIIDDGSTDNTPALLAGINDPRIKVIRQDNQGEAGARNLALDHATGEYLGFLDADDKFFLNFLENMAAYLSSHPEWDACYCDGWYMDTDGNLLRPLSDQRRGPFTDDLFETLIRASDVFGPPTCTLIRRKLITDQKLRFDPRIVIGPDWDFLTKVSQFARWGYLDFKGVMYRVHHTNITLTTGAAKRRESLAICRENAIQNARFDSCSAGVKAYAFFDLLINLLFDQPERQEEWLHSPQFCRLHNRERARLLRLTAARSIADMQITPFTRFWLRESLALNATDLKTWLLFTTEIFFPGVARKLLANRYQPATPGSNSPFNFK